jgi:hypothetical protein
VLILIANTAGDGSLFVYVRHACRHLAFEVRNNKKERKQQGRKKKTRRKKEHGRNFILKLKIAHKALLSFFAVALCYSVISLLNLNASTGSKQISS